MGSPISKSGKVGKLHVEPSNEDYRSGKPQVAERLKQAAQTEQHQINHPRQCNSNEHNRRRRNRHNRRPRQCRRQRNHKDGGSPTPRNDDKSGSDPPSRPNPNPNPESNSNKEKTLRRYNPDLGRRPEIMGTAVHKKVGKMKMGWGKLMEGRMRCGVRVAQGVGGSETGKRNKSRKVGRG